MSEGVEKMIADYDQKHVARLLSFLMAEDFPLHGGAWREAEQLGVVNELSKAYKDAVWAKLEHL